MASMNFSSSKQFVRPPQRGIFPLDHDAECKPYMKVQLYCNILMFPFVSLLFTHALSLLAFCLSNQQKVYLDCLKGEKQQHNKCRELSKEYLQCRMDSQLMAKEDLNEVRFFCASTVLYILIIILVFNPRTWNGPYTYHTYTT
jgi:hypothetical protein